MEQRHVQELTALEVGLEEGEADEQTGVSVLSDSLYSCRVGTDDVKTVLHASRLLQGAVLMVLLAHP